MTRNRIIPIFVPHAGCPHQCVFCDQRSISGRHAPVGAADVTREIAQALPRCGKGAEVAFYGGSFTAIPVSQQRELLGAAQPFLRSGDVSAIRVSTRPDAIGAEVLGLLREHGVRTVELGCQSLDDTVLRRAERGHSAADIRNASAMLRQAGFSLVLQMMTGLPGDSDETAIRTAREIIALQPDGVRIYPAVVVRGTPMHALWQARRYRPQTLEEATELCATLFELYRAAGIPVIRTGLQATVSLSEGDAVAGPYHPAFGELVKSRVYRRRAAVLLTPHRGAKTAVLVVAANRISLMTGQKRCNLDWLRETMEIESIKIMPLPLEDWQICLQSVDGIGKIAK